VGNFNNPEADLDRFRFRLGFAAAFVLLCFGILIGRFVWLQVIQHDFYQTRAEDNRIALIPIVPNRGVITDRNGVVLAHNYSAFTLEITPPRQDNSMKPSMRWPKSSTSSPRIASASNACSTKPRISSPFQFAPA
jgi:penicillin-binding protein 2